MTEYFLAKLVRMEEFASPHHAIAARAFTTSVFTFCYDVLATQPWAYPVFQQNEIVRPEIRRAIFRRTYILLYRITDTAIILLEIFHTRQENIGLPDEADS